ncbi:MAG: hypothetical protein HOY69_01035 [Streptomyces sp.]|nr:hypothetical protein [Streptomyces sp.]
MRTATAAIAALLISTVALTACGDGDSGHQKHADQLKTCADTTGDIDDYGQAIETNLSVARSVWGVGDTSEYMSTANTDIRDWSSNLAVQRTTDISPDLKTAMNTLLLKLQPLQDATDNPTAEPPRPDPSIQIYSNSVDSICRPLLHGPLLDQP